MANDSQSQIAFQQFNEKVRSLDLPEIENICIDGEIHRFGPKKIGWYRLEDDGFCLFGDFGNHKQNNDDNKSSHYFEYQYKEQASEEDKKVAQERRHALSQQREEIEKNRHIQAEKEAQRIWNAATGVQNHPYLLKKGVESLGVRITTERVPGLTGPKLVIPFYSLDKRLCTLHFIDESGKKSWLSGGSKKGHYYRIPGSTDTLYIAEGYATAASIHMATQQTVAMAGDAGNLALVANGFRNHSRKLRIVICADNDQWTAGNPGVSAAQAAAKAINAKVIIPQFNDITNKPTDFNDLHQLEGISEVARQLNAAKDCPETNRVDQGDTPVVTRLSEVTPKPVSWLWEERFARGKLSIIAGDPGLGKSLLSLDIAAHVTLGKPWPVDETPCPTGDVILLSAEDDIADTIRPRLDALQAKVSRVHAFTMVRTTDPETGKFSERSVSLRKDIGVLSDLLNDNPECVLVILDPVSAYMEGVDTHKNADVRALLTPLSRLAENHSVAILAVTHLNKGDGKNAMYRATGSLAFIAAARAVYLVTKDAEDPELRLMLPIKNNLGYDSNGLAYRVSVAENGAPCVEWDEDPVMKTADEALSPSLPDEQKTALEEAVEWLREVLKEGPVDSALIKKQANNDGISWATLRRAKDQLKIKAGKRLGQKCWSWELPEESQVVHQDAHLSNMNTEQDAQVVQAAPVTLDEQVEQLGQVTEKPKEKDQIQVAQAENLSNLNPSYQVSSCSNFNDEQLKISKKLIGKQQDIQLAQVAQERRRGGVEPLGSGQHASTCSSSCSNEQVESASDHSCLDGIEVRYIHDIGEAKAAVNDLVASNTLLGFDIETARKPEYQDDKKAGLDPYKSTIRLVQLYQGGSSVYVFDVKEPGILEVLAPIWSHPLVAHNALFEIKHLLNTGITLTRIGCSMLQANALTGQLPSLKQLAQQHLEISLDKRFQASDWSDKLSKEQIEYAAMDAVVTRKLAKKLAPLLKQRDLVSTYTRMKQAQRAIAQLELNGIYFDATAHQALIDTWTKQRDEARTNLAAILGADVNPASGQQVGQWLKEKLDKKVLHKWPHTKTGRLKTDAATLRRFADLPVVQPLLKYKDASKRLSTYGVNYAKHINPVTGRIHANYRLGGTATGRLACNAPNLQNPPRDPEFRALFCAPKGKTLIVADYTQIELRVAALISQDRAMLEVYRNGEDLHRKTAASVLGISAEEVSRDQRQMAKAVNFGLLYGQGAEGLSRYAKASYGVDMSLREAKSAIAAFFQAYPQLRAWQRRTGNEAERRKKVSTKGGRIRDFSKEASGYRYTEALNTPIQGTAAEVLLETLAILDKRLSGLDAKLVNIVHDELVLEVAEQDAEETKRAVEQAMTQGYLALFPNAKDMLAGIVEAHIGKNWIEAKS